MPEHENEDLDYALEYADDEREDELDTKSPEEDSNREEDGVEIVSEIENVCDVNI